MKLRLITIRSAFYSPVIVVAKRFLEPEGLEGDLFFRDQEESNLPAPGDTVVIEQKAPSASMTPLAQGKTEVPIHIAAINTRDGFYIVAREPKESFALKDLEGGTLVPASFAVQPEACLRFCLHEHGVDASKISFVHGLDGMDRAQQAFRDGQGDYVHLQDPLAEELVQERCGHKVASVGRLLGPISFSTLQVQPQVISDHAELLVTFLRAYGNALVWMSEQDPSAIASCVAEHFPNTSEDVVETAIRDYKGIETWPRSPMIDRHHYQRAAEMFTQQSDLTGVTESYPYETCCNDELAKRAS